MLQINKLAFFYSYKNYARRGFGTVYYIIYICYIVVIIVLFHVVVCCRFLYVLLLLFEISLFVLFQRGRYVSESASERKKKKIFDFRG